MAKYNSIGVLIMLHGNGVDPIKEKINQEIWRSKGEYKTHKLGDGVFFHINHTIDKHEVVTSQSDLAGRLRRDHESNNKFEEYYDQTLRQAEEIASHALSTQVQLPYVKPGLEFGLSKGSSVDATSSFFVVDFHIVKFKLIEAGVPPLSDRANAKLMSIIGTLKQAKNAYDQAIKTHKQAEEKCLSNQLASNVFSNYTKNTAERKLLDAIANLTEKQVTLDQAKEAMKRALEDFYKDFGSEYISVINRGWKGVGVLESTKGTMSRERSFNARASAEANVAGIAYEQTNSTNNTSSNCSRSAWVKMNCGSLSRPNIKSEDELRDYITSDPGEPKDIDYERSSYEAALLNAGVDQESVNYLYDHVNEADRLVEKLLDLRCKVRAIDADYENEFHSFGRDQVQLTKEPHSARVSYLLKELGGSLEFVDQALAIFYDGDIFRDFSALNQEIDDQEARIDNILNELEILVDSKLLHVVTTKIAKGKQYFPKTDKFKLHISNDVDSLFVTSEMGGNTFQVQTPIMAAPKNSVTIKATKSKPNDIVITAPGKVKDDYMREARMSQTSWSDPDLAVRLWQHQKRTSWVRKGSHQSVLKGDANRQPGVITDEVRHGENSFFLKGVSPLGKARSGREITHRIFAKRTRRRDSFDTICGKENNSSKKHCHRSGLFAKRGRCSQERIERKPLSPVVR